MTSEDLVVELMTSGQRLPGGHAEAMKLLGELRHDWGRGIANRQRNAHDELRPYFHGGQPCREEYDCHVRKVINLAEGATKKVEDDRSPL